MGKGVTQAYRIDRYVPIRCPSHKGHRFCAAFRSGHGQVIDSRRATAHIGGTTLPIGVPGITPQCLNGGTLSVVRLQNCGKATVESPCSWRRWRDVRCP
jgi:hypothetical protein